MTIGEIIAPSNIPNLNHSLFGKLNILGYIKANNKKIADTIIAKGLSSLDTIVAKRLKSLDTIISQRLNSFEIIKGYIAINKKTIEKTIPKDLSEPRSVGMWLVVSSIIAIPC